MMVEKGDMLFDCCQSDCDTLVLRPKSSEFPGKGRIYMLGTDVVLTPGQMVEMASKLLTAAQELNRENRLDDGTI